MAQQWCWILFLLTDHFQPPKASASSRIRQPPRRTHNYYVHVLRVIKFLSLSLPNTMSRRRHSCGNQIRHHRSFTSQWISQRQAQSELHLSIVYRSPDSGYLPFDRLARQREERSFCTGCCGGRLRSPFKRASLQRQTHNSRMWLRRNGRRWSAWWDGDGDCTTIKCRRILADLSLLPILESSIVEFPFGNGDSLDEPGNSDASEWTDAFYNFDHEESAEQVSFARRGMGGERCWRSLGTLLCRAKILESGLLSWEGLCLRRYLRGVLKISRIFLSAGKI